MPIDSPVSTRRTTAVVALAIVAMLGLASCSSTGTTASAVVTEVPTTPATTTTTTVAPTTTEATTTTAAPTTSTSTTTTLFPPPADQPEEPIWPPADPYGPEPVVELGFIEIPEIGLVSPLYQGIRLTTLDRGPGHWPGTALPGADGNTVVSAHRTSHGRQFRHLDRLEPGDEILFHTYDGVHVYQVTRTEIVGPDALWIVDQTDEATATLFACHPPGSTRERIVVFADLVTD